MPAATLPEKCRRPTGLLLAALLPLALGCAAPRGDGAEAAVVPARATPPPVVLPTPPVPDLIPEPQEEGLQLVVLRVPGMT